MNQIIEISKHINENYDKEIRILIKNRSVFKLDNKPILRPPLNEEEKDENGLLSIISCGASRKTTPQQTDKKEDCIIF